MLQQLVLTLPAEAGTCVKLRHPKKAEEGTPLWEDVTKMFEEGETRLREGNGERRILNLCVKG